MPTRSGKAYKRSVEKKSYKDPGRWIHEVIEDDDGQQWLIRYRTPAERQKQIGMIGPPNSRSTSGSKSP